MEQGDLTKGKGISRPAFPPSLSGRSKCWGNRSAEVAATGRSDHLLMNSMRISVCASLPLLSQMKQLHQEQTLKVQPVLPISCHRHYPQVRFDLWTGAHLQT